MDLNTIHEIMQSSSTTVNIHNKQVVPMRVQITGNHIRSEEEIAEEHDTDVVGWGDFLRPESYEDLRHKSELKKAQHMTEEDNARFGI